MTEDRHLFIQERVALARDRQSPALVSRNTLSGVTRRSTLVERSPIIEQENASQAKVPQETPRAELKISFRNAMLNRELIKKLKLENVKWKSVSLNASHTIVSKSIS